MPFKNYVSLFKSWIILETLSSFVELKESNINYFKELFRVLNQIRNKSMRTISEARTGAATVIVGFEFLQLLLGVTEEVTISINND